MKALTIFEFGKIVQSKDGVTEASSVPERVFLWLESLCLTDHDPPTWLRLTQQNGQRAIQVQSYVGVIRAPCGFQIEVLPKIAKVTTEDAARTRLLEMLKCLVGFRHIKTANADLKTVKMPLLEVFIQQFLSSVAVLVKRGVRSDYVSEQSNLFALRGKLLISKQLSQNIVRKDRFFTEHDEFIQNRAENRLIHSALRCALTISNSQENQRMARELCFVFSDVPLSSDVTQDIKRIRLDRGMSYYESALDWAQLILKRMSPISGVGNHHAQSLLFPMEAVFEAYVEKHLAKQLQKEYFIKAQASNQHLVKHNNEHWFRMKPDFLVQDSKKETYLLLDAKWKLLDVLKNNKRDKYQLSQADFYQLYAYGCHYLSGNGDMVLIYPQTETFTSLLLVFEFPQSSNLRLWVLPFCLSDRRLILPDCLPIQNLFLRQSTMPSVFINRISLAIDSGDSGKALLEIE